MAALGGIGQQQTAFVTSLGEMKLRKQMQDDMMRQMTIENMLQYLRTSYEAKKAREEAARRRKQALVGKIATLGAAGIAGPLAGAIGGGGGGPISAVSEANIGVGGTSHFNTEDFSRFIG